MRSAAVQPKNTVLAQPARSSSVANASGRCWRPRSMAIRMHRTGSYRTSPTLRTHSIRHSGSKMHNPAAIELFGLPVEELYGNMLGRWRFFAKEQAIAELRRLPTPATAVAESAFRAEALRQGVLSTSIAFQEPNHIRCDRYVAPQPRSPSHSDTRYMD